MTLELAPEVRVRLDQHLDAVEQTLMRASRSREQRRGVVDDLETQVLDMLGQESSSPTVVDLEKVLRRLDPPQAYAGSIDIPAGVPPPAAVPPVPAKRPRRSKTALLALLCIFISALGLLGSVIGIFVIREGITPMQRLSFGDFRTSVERGDFNVVSVQGEQGRYWLTGYPRNTAGRERPAAFSRPVSAIVDAEQLDGEKFQQFSDFCQQHDVVLRYGGSRRPFFERDDVITCIVVGIAAATLGLFGTALGWMAVGQIYRSRGTVYGLGSALTAGLFYPIIACVIPFLSLA